MQAIVYDRFGPPEVLEVREVPAPAARAGYARIAIHAAALNPKDVLIRKGRLRWFTRAPFPRIPGYDFAGELLDATPDLPRGAAVFGMIQAHRGGACAQIAAVPHDQFAARPAGLSMIEAAALPLAALTALQALRDEIGVRSGDHVLINGASGGVGTVAVQIAKALGAVVTATCSAPNAALVTGLGADAVVDYRAQNVLSVKGFTHVFDVFGNLPWPAVKASLGSEGRACTTVPSPGALVRGGLRRLGLHRAALVVVRSRRADLEQLLRWVGTGQLRPVIDRVVPWADSAQAHAHLETRRARGKVVIEVPPVSPRT